MLINTVVGVLIIHERICRYIFNTVILLQEYEQDNVNEKCAHLGYYAASSGLAAQYSR